MSLLSRITFLWFRARGSSLSSKFFTICSASLFDGSTRSASLSAPTPSFFSPSWIRHLALLM